MDTSREVLLELLARDAYQHRREGEEPFHLASGAASREYFDCKQVTYDPRGLAALADVVLASLRDDVEALGGLTMGADGLTLPAVQLAGIRGLRLLGFSVRKQAKEHGRQRRIEGTARPGMRVCIVDDVVTSGGSTIEAIDAAREHGLVIAQVLVLVDRQEQGGMASIRASVGPDVPVAALFTRAEVHAAWERQPR